MSSDPKIFSASRATARETPNSREICSSEGASPSQGPNQFPALKWHILIAEDELSEREFLDFVLRDKGYITYRAVDGQEALEFAMQHGPFDLLLTDLVMPRMGGVELVQRLREIQTDLKVLYFTGFGNRLFEEKVALSEDEALLSRLFQYRFQRGRGLKGHSF